MAAKVTIKPFKLKPSSGDKITRDDVTTWKEVLLSHMRQNESWHTFLPGGANQNWTAADDGVNGWLNFETSVPHERLTLRKAC